MGSGNTKGKAKFSNCRISFFDEAKLVKSFKAPNKLEVLITEITRFYANGPFIIAYNHPEEGVIPIIDQREYTEAVVMHPKNLQLEVAYKLNRQSSFSLSPRRKEGSMNNSYRNESILSAHKQGSFYESPRIIQSPSPDKYTSNMTDFMPFERERSSSPIIKLQQMIKIDPPDFIQDDTMAAMDINLFDNWVVRV